VAASHRTARRAVHGIGQLAALGVAALALSAWLGRTTLELAEQLAGPGTATERLTALGLDHAVELPLAALGALSSAWLALHALAGLVVVVGAATGRPSRSLARLVARRSPALVRHLTRRAAGAGLGLGISASVVLAGAGGAFAAPHEHVAAPYVSVAAPADPRHGSIVGPGGDADATAQSPLDLGWRASGAPTTRAPTTVAQATPAAAPAPESGPQPAEHRPVPPTHTHPEARVVVHLGDSLWSIAAAHLAPHATDAQIARAWPTWYAANRAAIGPDPGLLRPGTTLVIPPKDSR
jgi:hypothetical protein